MSATFTKLFSGLTESTVWVEAYPTRILWVAMLSWADQHGRVYGALPGIARRAGITLEEAEAAMQSFMSPDRYSRTKEHEGRRAEAIEGGWRLLNYQKYRDMRDEEKRREQNREAQAKYREKKLADALLMDADSKQGNQVSAQAEAEAEKTIPHRASLQDRESGDLSTSCALPAVDNPSQPRTVAEILGLPPSDIGKASERGAMSALLLANGVRGTTPGHPLIAEWIGKGVTREHLAEAVARARVHKPKPASIPIAYLAPIVEEVMAGPKVKDPAAGWMHDEQAALLKGKELGISPGLAEDWHSFRGRIRGAIESRGRQQVAA